VAVDLLTALLAGGRGLTSGLLANREEKKKAADEARALAYRNAQNALAQSNEDRNYALKVDELNNVKKVNAQTAADKAAALRDYYGDMVDKWNQDRTSRDQNVHDQISSRETIAAADRAVREAGQALGSGRATIDEARGHANSLTYQLQQLAAQKSKAMAILADPVAKRDVRLAVAAQNTIASTDSLIALTRKQLDVANRIAGGYAASAPVAPIFNSAGEDTVGMGVRGATPDAIETPAGADTVRAPQGNPAPAPTASESRGPVSFMMPTLYDALSNRGAPVPTAPTHTPGPVPPEIRAKIESIARSKGLTPGTARWDKEVATRMILWQRQHTAGSQ